MTVSVRIHHVRSSLIFSPTYHNSTFSCGMLLNVSRLYEVQPICYFFSMLRCISHEWHIPCDYTSIVPLYKVTGNYPAVALYSTHVDAELDKMCATQVLNLIHESSARFLTPINAVIKNSDRNRARTIAHINITDQDSLTRASFVLVAQGLSKLLIHILIRSLLITQLRVSIIVPILHPAVIPQFQML